MVLRRGQSAGRTDMRLDFRQLGCVHQAGHRRFPCEREEQVLRLEVGTAEGFLRCYFRRLRGPSCGVDVAGEGNRPPHLMKRNVCERGRWRTCPRLDRKPMGPKEFEDRLMADVDRMLSFVFGDRMEEEGWQEVLVVGLAYEATVDLKEGFDRHLLA